MSAVNVNADGVFDAFYQKLLIVNLEGATLDDGMWMMAYETVAHVEEDFTKRYHDRHRYDRSLVQFQDDEGDELDSTLTVFELATAQRKARNEAVVLVVELLRRIRCQVCREDRNRTVVTFPRPCKGALLVVDVLAGIHKAQLLVYPRWPIEINGVPFVWDEDHLHPQLRVSGLALHGDTGMVQIRILVGTAAEERAAWAKRVADTRTEEEASGRAVTRVVHHYDVDEQTSRNIVAEMQLTLRRAKRRAKRTAGECQEALDDAYVAQEVAREEHNDAKKCLFLVEQQLLAEAPPAPPAPPAQSATAGECPICLMVITQLCALVPCGHSVCADCMDSAAATGVCPMCRGVLGATVNTLVMRVYM